MTNKLQEASSDAILPTIALCMIAKDKEAIIERALNSTLIGDQPMFDYYCLVDTGSSDKTVEVFKSWVYKHGSFGDVREKEVGKDYDYVEIGGEKILADFASARNDSFDIARKFNADWAFWIDTDDILVGADKPATVRGIETDGIHELAVLAEKKGANQVGMVYNYHKTGNLKTVTQRRERLIKLDSPGKWIGEVHENYLVDNPEDAKILFIDHIYVDHLRTANEAANTSRRNNMIMKRALEEKGADKISDKMLRDLAYDHWEHSEWEKSIELYNKYLKRPELQEATNPEAIHDIRIKLAKAYLGLADMPSATSEAIQAMALMPERGSSYLLLAEIYGNLGLWDEAITNAEKVLELGIPRTTSPINEIEYTVVPLRILSQAYKAKGKYKESKRMSMKARELMPENTSFLEEVNELDDMILKRDTIKSIADIVKFYIDNNKGKEVDKILSVIPLELKDESVVRELIKEIRHEHNRNTKKYKLSGSKKIVIYAGAHFESWNGDSDKNKGIGGSEGMAIQMARALTALGNKVIVYNECGADDGEVFDGVLYQDHRKWKTDLECDVFISLRNPQVFKYLPLITAKKQYLWLHDTIYGDQEASNFYAPNKTIVLSEYHKEIIAFNHNLKDDSKFWVTRNALNKIALENTDKKKIKRQPYKMIYASSYDRGLEHALEMLPALKAEIPELELHIFYGWNTYDAMMKMRAGTPVGNHMQELKEKLVKMMDQDGIVHHGRVSQNELYEHFASSDVWFYPTEFTEISCINAMTAQALGAIPICTPVAALKETVNSKYGIKTTLEKFEETTLHYLKNREKLEQRRAPMMEWAREEFNIDSLAKEWDKAFNED